MEEGTALDLTVANSVANAMKNWAIEKGVTHYTHWFQPMTGITAEKHDSFISPISGGKVIMEFSGKELIKGEPDGSSFPSGGLRATCEARGYTAWDPTSYAFIKDGSLCIPTAFCSYSGESLDKKTPLLRSMEVIDKQCRRILKLFGKDVKKVTPTVGPEQEYFLIDKDLYNKRKDLMFCNRTLFGAKPPKGQELEDHYFGAIKPRVDAFMKELDEELWKLGILSKTKHNEVAPCQHEMAPIFTTTNLSTDQNQLTMEIMKKVAQKHNLVCILHEKPFAGVNGSGKHNNWSLSTNTGENLLEPGNTPEDNAQFLLVLTAIIKAVDEYQDLLRLSVAFAGNDHRLGADEAPPAIISIFLGDELTAILEAIMSGKPYDKKAKEVMKLGVDILPAFPKDNTDRNRTSPFAFTGNKFEFRSLGSSMSISCPNIMLNTITAEALCQFADELEKADDFNSALNTLIKRTLSEHKRIIFNGDGYSQEWVEEAERRGLSNLKTTTDALPHFLDEKNVQLFQKHKVPALEEEGQHAGAHMGAGEGLVGADRQCFGLVDGPELLRQGLGVGQAVAVGDEDHVHLSLLGKMGPVQLRQGLQGLFPAPDLAPGGDMARQVAPEDGLDIQHGADGSGGAADPARGLQEIQIVHGEEIQGVHHFGVQDGAGLGGGLALLPKLCGPDRQQTGAEARAQGIHRMDGPAREFVHQLLRRQPGGLIGAADARGHAHIDHVQALLQLRPEKALEEMAVEQAGLHPGAAAQLIVISLRVEGIDIALVDALPAVHGIVAGQGADIQPLQVLSGQIGRGIGENSIAHRHPPVDHIVPL